MKLVLIILFSLVAFIAGAPVIEDTFREVANLPGLPIPGVPINGPVQISTNIKDFNPAGLFNLVQALGPQLSKILQGLPNSIDPDQISLQGNQVSILVDDANGAELRDRAIQAFT